MCYDKEGGEGSKSTTLFMDGTLGVGARMGAHWRFAEDAPVQGLGTLAAGGRCC